MELISFGHKNKKPQASQPVGWDTQDLSKHIPCCNTRNGGSREFYTAHHHMLPTIQARWRHDRHAAHRFPTNP